LSAPPLSAFAFARGLVSPVGVGGNCRFALERNLLAIPQRRQQSEDHPLMEEIRSEIETPSTGAYANVRKTRFRPV
jgi:hypothetical protein